MTTPVDIPSIERAINGLPQVYRELLLECYKRILPVLLKLLTPHDIWERNRAWPGVRPTRKGATQLLQATQARRVKQAIVDYSAGNPGEQEAELQSLVRAYCQYGPIGLLDAMPSSLPPLINPNLQACADFHRLAKHRRADAGAYIRDILARYATDLQLPPLPPFVARYAFAQDRRSEQWFVGEGNETEHVPKADRRLNQDLTYVHQRWRWCARPLTGRYVLSERHPQPITPWVLWLYECLSGVLMGLRVCATAPSLQDVLLTLRWSIWHYGEPMWAHRGAPEDVLLPEQLIPVALTTQPALAYLHTRLVWESDRGSETGWPGFSEEIQQWLEHTQHAAPRTLVAVHDDILAELHRDTQARFYTASTPSWLREQGVSLPWSTGIAAVGLLPSGGHAVVMGGKVYLFGVPFDAPNLEDETSVELRYDPDDARTIYLIHHGAHVTSAPASAFEGVRVTWYELVPDLHILN